MLTTFGSHATIPVFLYDSCCTIWSYLCFADYLLYFGRFTFCFAIVSLYSTYESEYPRVVLCWVVSFLCIQARINLSKYVKHEKTLRIGKKNFYCNFINIQNIIPATVEYESVCIKYSTWKNSLFFVTIMMVFVIPINRSSFESLNVNTFLQNQLQLFYHQLVICEIFIINLQFSCLSRRFFPVIPASFTNNCLSRNSQKSVECNVKLAFSYWNYSHIVFLCLFDLLIKFVKLFCN